MDVIKCESEMIIMRACDNITPFILTHCQRDSALQWLRDIIIHQSESEYNMRTVYIFGITSYLFTTILSQETTTNITTTTTSSTDNSTSTTNTTTVSSSDASSDTTTTEIVSTQATTFPTVPPKEVTQLLIV